MKGWEDADTRAEEGDRWRHYVAVCACGFRTRFLWRWRRHRCIDLTPQRADSGEAAS